MVEPVRQLSLFARIDAWTERFRVTSQTQSKVSYVVAMHRDRYFGCSCPRWKYAGGRPEARPACKHIREVVQWSGAFGAGSRWPWPGAGPIEASAESVAASPA